jgi:DNA-binding MarR family transcriptional regulator
VIRDRMIEEGTTITRILDALERAGLVRRERGGDDRRIVLCRATARGRALLDRLQADVDAADEAAVASLGTRELGEFLRMLNAVRLANSARGAPRHRAQPAGAR